MDPEPWNRVPEHGYADKIIREDEDILPDEIIMPIADNTFTEELFRTLATGAVSKQELELERVKEQLEEIISRENEVAEELARAPPVPKKPGRREDVFKAINLRFD